MLGLPLQLFVMIMAYGIQIMLFIITWMLQLALVLRPTKNRKKSDPPP